MIINVYSDGSHKIIGQIDTKNLKVRRLEDNDEWSCFSELPGSIEDMLDLNNRRNGIFNCFAYYVVQDFPKDFIAKITLMKLTEEK